MRLLLLINTFFYLLPFLFFFIFKRKNKEKAVRVIFFYAAYCIIQELLSGIFQFNSVLRPYASLLFASYTIIEFSFFSLFYYYLFPKKYKARKVIVGIWGVFSAFAVIDYFLINKNQQFDSFAIGIESIILILMCGYYLYYQVTHTMSMMVYNTFNFWTIVTFLIYVSATFFLYLMTDSMGNDPQFRAYYFYINIGANILKNGLLAFAFTRVFLQPPKENKSRIAQLDLGDELILQQNT